ncbi:hypothetical protein E2C01_052004 [Portunus trituberculatus]|uniref:Uncharacterized protein n=1 Tax=Portunus trituberculatus TaxID=210409 RepID=A0A5B7GGE7_PORTR|nr:hypothetical protein [Portunus trituberculatus]
MEGTKCGKAKTGERKESEGQSGSNDQRQRVLSRSVASPGGKQLTHRYSTMNTRSAANDSSYDT